MGEHFDADYIVIGSGFGGAVAALRLAEKGYRVIVLEQGRRWQAADFPDSNWQLRRWIWRPALGLRGFFNMRFFRHMVVLQGHAVGGGSITYGNTLLVPPDSVWQQGSWAGLQDWSRLMPAHFATASRMLGVTTNRLPGPADERLREMAAQAGLSARYRLTDVGVYFGADGETGKVAADPYFAGKGPERVSCTGCGGCMVGCKVGAKNTLDRNYLYLAEQLGATIHAETRVVDVRPLAVADGSDGYLVSTQSTAAGGGARRQWRTRGVVFAASSLGTQELLFALRERGSLPRISPALGRHVRTNAESLIGVRFPGSQTDLSSGIAIGSSLYLDQNTHIEAVRYPAGSDAMGLLATVMTRAGGGRRLRWLAGLAAQLLRRPLASWRALRPAGFARESMIFLCMQTLDGELTLRWQRRWFWPFARRLATHGAPVPTCIPAANLFAEQAAEALGGIAQTSLPEILLDVPLTAHCIGGAVMAATPQEGVCDAQQRVFGYRNMLICDGSVLAANLGVNPSLTITALVEHAMSWLPQAGAEGGQ